MLPSTTLAVVWALLTAGLSQAQSNTTEWPVHDNGLNTMVEWDHYSFKVNGQRLFIFSGEFHYWRFPVPELWKDLLEKIKAAGFNAFSIYAHWGYHAPSASTLDFTSGAHNFTSILTLAAQLGLYVIVRPGPYVNAESNAGGLPLWVASGAYGSLRDDDPRYTAAWTPYWAAVAKLVAPHLVTNGGTVVLFQIENEYGQQWDDLATTTPDVSAGHYMALLEATARDNGIDVPLVHNNPNMRAYSWSKDFSGEAAGNVDVVGVDSYPSCWSCDLTECTGTNGQYKAYQVVNYYDYFQAFSPTQPHFMPEFQGGSYNPWTGPAGGCPSDVGVDFANLFYRNLVYQRVTAVSLYMVFGGTNWGWLGFPLVGTSYDYSSPVSENRAIGDKYYETKLLAMFTRVAADLAHTDRVVNDTSLTSNAAVTTAELRNDETGAGFYVVMHLDSTSSTLETFKLSVKTSQGRLKVPQHGGSVAINGHQAKILPTDFSFGGKKLLYSTAEVLTYSVLNGTEVLAVWLPTGESGELVVEGVTSASLAKAFSNSSSTTVSLVPGNSSVAINWSSTGGMTVVDLADGSRVVILDRAAAYLFWAPNLGNDPLHPVNNTVLVQGPYLVRSAATSADGTLALSGDINKATQITIFTPPVSSVTWNGRPIAITSTDGNMLTATLDGPADFSLPPLGPWKSQDSLPEIQANYTASSATWITANLTTSSNPGPPAPNNPVLYVDEYAIHTGYHLYHATFPTAAQTGVYLNLTGGAAFGASVWLNGAFLGSHLGSAKSAAAALTLSFANATLADTNTNTTNVLTVLMENTGHDETSGVTHPRGIWNATLLGGPDVQRTNGFAAWQIAGPAGRERNIDPIRGPYNEGGLYAERVGAHLPGYPDSEWAAVDDNNNNNNNNATTGSATTTLAVPGAGVRVFRTVVPLAVPAGLDVSVAFVFSAPGNGNVSSSFSSEEGLGDGYTNQVRALLFVNGYQYGRFSPFVGNQVRFPVPTGILDTNGENTIVVTVWSQSARGAAVGVAWEVEYVHASGYDMGFDAAYLRPAWGSERLVYG